MVRPSFQRKKIKMRNGKMKNYIVIWQPLSSYTASEMKVVDAFSSDSTLAIVRNDIEQRAAQGLYSSHGEGLITVAEKPSNTYHILSAFHHELNDQVVDVVNNRPVTRRELAKAFDKVAPEDNWKNRIDCEVSMTAEEKALVAKAVRFFTGSVAHFEPRSQIGRLTRYHLTADGYYNTIDRPPDK